MRTPPRPVEPWSHILRLDNGRRAPEPFVLEPPAEVRRALADRLGILGLRKLRFAGRLEPQGRRDWQLTADLGATASQACVVTMAPVTSRIDEAVERTYLEEMPDLPEGEEVEMPDDTVEQLPAALDLGAVMAEALALALPLWPRAEGVEMEERVFAEPGTRPMTDEDTRPFADLKNMMRRDGDDT